MKITVTYIEPFGDGHMVEVDGYEMFIHDPKIGRHEAGDVFEIELTKTK